MFVSFLFFSRHPFRIQVSWYSGTYPFTGRISHKISPPICISTCAWKISNPWVSRPRFLAPCASCWFTLFLVRQDHANRWQIQQTRTFHSFRKGEARSFFSISMQSSLFSRSLLRRFRRGTVVHHDGPYTVRQETAIRLWRCPGKCQLATG